jgi:hypothetical protein
LGRPLLLIGDCTAVDVGEVDGFNGQILTRFFSIMGAKGLLG